MEKDAWRKIGVIMRKPESLYIHIPFCAQKCAYCDFVSFTCDKDFRQIYMETLCKELDLIGLQKNKPHIKTIFIGGGTPSLLSIREIQMLGACLQRNFNLDGLLEFTIESNPGTVEGEKLMKWRQIGVDRVSMGVQSMNDDLLKKLGRIHSAQVARESFHIIRSSGIENINLDLMFGLPDQTIEDLKETLDEVLALGPDHISAYSLKIEEDTPFERMLDKKELRLPSEEEDREMYHFLIEALKDKGFKHYEISNFALEGKACKHNLVYWKGAPYFAAGLAAHGYVDGVREGNHTDFAKYKEAVEKGQKPVQTRELISCEEAAFEYIMLGLRLSEGVDLRDFQNQFGYKMQDRFKDVIQRQLDQGLVRLTDDYLALTAYGLDVSNQVMADYMDLV